MENANICVDYSAEFGYNFLYEIILFGGKKSWVEH